MERLSYNSGSCPRSLMLRNSAYHKLWTMIADLFRIHHLEVYKEIYCIVVSKIGNQNKRVVTIMLNRLKSKSLIFDPTIGWETNNVNQDVKVNEII